MKTETEIRKLRDALATIAAAHFEHGNRRRFNAMLKAAEALSWVLEAGGGLDDRVAERLMSQAAKLAVSQK